MFGEDRMLGAVVARPTFRIDGEHLVPTPDDPWPIDGAPRETPYGVFPADTPFLSGGVDLFVVGNAYAPGGRPTAELEVDIRVGTGFHRAIRVIGDRVWRAGPVGKLRRKQAVPEPTPPVPFTAMPLTYDRAFGGKTLTGDFEYAWPANPLGRGLYLSAESAEGNPLPNLEDPAAPIASWEDRPEPVGLAPYPPDGSLRALNALDLELDPVRPADARIRRITPLFFNSAHPRMILPPKQTPRAGELVEVTHVRPSGSLRFTMPDLAFHAHVRLEDRSRIVPLHLDQIGILAEEARVFLSYRVAFSYRLTPLERRRVTLHQGPAPAEVPETYVVAWET